jgi:hypothetical protein
MILQEEHMGIKRTEEIRKEAMKKLLSRPNDPSRDTHQHLMMTDF